MQPFSPKALRLAQNSIFQSWPYHWTIFTQRLNFGLLRKINNLHKCNASIFIEVIPRVVGIHYLTFVSIIIKTIRIYSLFLINETQNSIHTGIIFVYHPRWFLKQIFFVWFLICFWRVMQWSRSNHRRK